MRPIDIFVILFVAAIVIGAVIYLINKKKSNTSVCGCSCDDCSINCPSRKKD